MSCHADARCPGSLKSVETANPSIRSTATSTMAPPHNSDLRTLADPRVDISDHIHRSRNNATLANIATKCKWAGGGGDEEIAQAAGPARLLETGCSARPRLRGCGHPEPEPRRGLGARRRRIRDRR